MVAAGMIRKIGGRVTFLQDLGAMAKNEFPITAEMVEEIFVAFLQKLEPPAGRNSKNIFDRAQTDTAYSSK
jgi:hypothetical protein